MDTRHYDFWKWHFSLPGRWSRGLRLTLIALSAVLLVLYYLGDGLFTAALENQSFFLGPAYHELILFVFSCSIIVAAAIYRIRWGLAMSLIGFFAVMPHALLLPAYPDPIYRTISWLVINGLLALVVGGGFNIRDRQQEYLREIINAQEQERQRISRELHDDTAQHLVDTAHAIDEIPEAHPDLPDDVTIRLRALRADVDSILEKTRNVVRGLQPPLVGEVGLKSALFGLCDEFEEQTGIDIKPVIAVSEEALDTEAKIAVFRIVQESLTNIRKHTHATQVSLEFTQQEGKVRLEVSDNGPGFAVTGMGKLQAAGKAGLLGIQQRTTLVHGVFHINSTKNGTTLRVEIPTTNNTQK